MPDRDRPDRDRPDRDRPDLRLLPGGQGEETPEEALARSKAAHPAGSARRDEDGDEDGNPPLRFEP